ncbi:outer membrane protein assembly factor BamA [Thioclava atlantica]|uniref:Outer membrane protein assembly factor BamA n=1 Tax=Thioclava atlantica TaxID=1317124 RepID=A0A085TX83_9RHOB|nr:outer membrane protein assembly factor BamA [Thioclava atlantica]KFE35330.1 outer membrane protein assembly factor YaeT [Thioclava atlantica]
MANGLHSVLRICATRKALRASVVFPAVAMTCVAVPVIAQAQQYSFSRVEIVGNERIEPATILSYARIARNTPVTAADLNAAYQRLTGSGLFESVSLTPRGNTLQITVQEYPTVNVINFEGNRIVKDAVLSKVIQTRSNRVFNPAEVEADAQRLVQAYADDGRMAARVTPKVIRRSGNRVDVAFEIKEGKVTSVERITFTGNRSFSDRRLRQVLATKQAGIFRTFVKNDTFNPNRVSVDRQKLIDFYRSRGYMDVDVRGVSSQMTRQRDAFYMTFNVVEGQKFHFNNVSTTSEIDGLDTSEYEKLARIRPGQTYSPQAIELAVTRMEQLGIKQGVQFLRVEPRVTQDQRTQAVNVDFALVRGPRVFVQRIDIEGNTATLDRVIRREFKTVEGDPYNPREVKNATDRVRALGFFKTVDVNTKQGSGPDQVVVDVNVEEQPTGSLGFGASYSKTDGVGFNASLDEKNFLGRGQYLGLSLGTTKDNNNSSFRFVEPRFLGRDVSFSFGAGYFTSSSATNQNFDTRRINLSPAFEFPVSERGRLQVRYKVGEDTLSNVSADSSQILKDEEATKGTQRYSGVGYTYSYDTSLEQIDPRFNWKFSLSQDFWGLGGDVTGGTTSAKIQGERKVFNEEVTLRASLEGGAVHATGGTTILQRYNGNQIRGFESYGIGPRDGSAPNNDALGGNYYWAGKVEAQFPIGLPEEYGITGGLFWDVGSVWGLDNTSGTSATVDDSMHIRSAVGVSIFWDSGIGPLRLNFSRAIKKEDYDRTQNFDLTLSTQF